MTTETFNTFNDISHIPLRVFNRVVMAYNIMEDFGKAAFEDYIAEFDQHERKQMFVMMQFIKEKGRDAARSFATKDLQLESEDVVRH